MGVGFSPLITPFLSDKNSVFCKDGLKKQSCKINKKYPSDFNVFFLINFRSYAQPQIEPLSTLFWTLSARLHLVKDTLQQHLLNKMIIFFYFFIPYFIFFYFHFSDFNIIEFIQIRLTPFKI